MTIRFPIGRTVASNALAILAIGVSCAAVRAQDGGPMGACCFGDDCIEATEKACAGEGGSYNGNGTECHPEACQGPPVGACCLGDDCLELTKKHCDAEQGEFNGEGTECHAEACHGPSVGACCLGDDCLELTKEHCGAEQGEFNGEGTECHPEACQGPPVGACCLGDDCLELTKEHCDAEQGKFNGVGSECHPNACQDGDPTGACCFLHDCVDLTGEHCAAEGGEYAGDGTHCMPHLCGDEPLGACCLGDNGCVNATGSACVAEGGVFFPGGGCDDLGSPCGSGGTRMSCDFPVAVAMPGDRVDVNLYVENVSDLRGYQTSIAVARTSGVGEVVVACPDGVSIDASRPNYVFFGESGTVSAMDCANARSVASLQSGSVDVGPSRRYLATYTLQVPSDAELGSTFDVTILPASLSALADSASNSIPFEIGSPCTLLVDDCVPIPFGDSNADRIVDLLDILCVLDGFSGVFDRCTLSDVDLDPCDGNGIVDLFDVLAILNAFTQQPVGCAGACVPPLPSRKPDRSSFTRTERRGRPGVASLVSERRTARGGDFIDVDLYVTGVSGLRGYQVAIDVIGAGADQVVLDRISVDRQRPDYAFRNRESMDAGDMVAGRLAVALVEGGVTSRERSYLGTFTFRVRAEVTDGFRFVFRAGGASRWLTSTGGRIDVTLP